MKEKAMPFPPLSTMEEIQESMKQELTQAEKAECWDSVKKAVFEVKYKSIFLTEMYKSLLVAEEIVKKARKP